ERQPPSGAARRARTPQGEARASRGSRRRWRRRPTARDDAAGDRTRGPDRRARPPSLSGARGDPAGRERGARRRHLDRVLARRARRIRRLLGGGNARRRDQLDGVADGHQPRGPPHVRAGTSARPRRGLLAPRHQRHRRNPRRDHEDRRVVDAAQGRRCIARIARNGSPAPRVRRRWSLRGRGLRAPPRPAPGRLDRRRLEEWASLTGGARARAQSARPRGGRARAGSGAPGAPTLASHRGAHVNLRTVCALTARLLFLMGAFQLFPLALAVLDRSEPAIRAYALSAVVCALAAYVLRLIGKGAPTTLHRKDAFGVVTLTWFSISLLGAIPFVVEGSIPNVLSAIFEAVSGFTT